MGLDKYYKFVLKPNTKTFNEIIKNMSEFKKVYDFNDNKLKTLTNKLKKKHLGPKGEFILEANIEGPLLSATCFPLDFKLPTEKQLWITAKSGDTQVWKLLTNYDFKQTYDKNLKLDSFQFNKITLESVDKLKKVENKLNTTGDKLAIGEFSMHFEKIKSEYYSIWEIGGTLIAVPYGTTKNSILNATWKFTGYGIPLDGGEFGFHNGAMFDYIRLNTKTDSKATLKNKHYFGEYFNPTYDYELGHHKKGVREFYTVIYGKDLININNSKLTEWVKTNKMEKELMGLYHPNLEGDGYYRVYKSDNMYMILNSDMDSLINTLFIDYFEKNTDEY